MKAAAIFFFTGLLFLVTLLFAIKGQQAKDPTDTPALAEAMVNSEALANIQESAQELGQILGWGVIAFAILLQGSAWIAAASKFKTIRTSKMSHNQRLQQLEAIEVYFDLPLYFGLLGSVLSFILITIFPDAGLMFAYVSTALGIVVSTILRLGYLTPYKQHLIATHPAEA